MKLNKKTNKFILTKKESNDFLIYADGYISNGNWLVKEDYFEFESDLLQDKLNKKVYFALRYGENVTIPNIKPFINTPEGKPVRVTNLLYKDDYRKENYSLLTNLANNKTIVMNSDFVEIIKLINGNVTQNINTNYSPVTVYKDGVLHGLFMPMQHREAENCVHQFLVDNMTDEQYQNVKNAA